ncbi:MAG: hypothetical protein QOD45_1515 [Pseudonocardiales bacterium]|nr:hypothetical protein [Pseudonocardiales bacterium]
MKGSLYKRCGCPPSYSAKGERLACKIRHGSWSFVADAGRDPATGRRRQYKRGRFTTRAEAEAALAEFVDAASKGTLAHDERQTVAAFLEHWLAEKQRLGLRPTTARSYRAHIDKVITPVIGHLRLRDVRPAHIEGVLREAASTSRGHRMSPATVRRVHATLRSAFGTAKRRRLIAYNPAVDVDLPTASRKRVQPWEPAELGTFLDHVAHDRMGPLFEVIAATGMRRGEAIGLRWGDVDLEAGQLVVRQQVLSLDGEQPSCATCGTEHRGAVFGPPKTASGDARTVELDSGVVGVLLAHRLSQDAERATWGSAYSDHDLVFARDGGTAIPPERVTKRFAALVREAGLRPVRLHDLRHGQASLMLAAAVPMAVVSKRLGHSTITLTSDTYSHLLAGVGRDAAERAAALVPRAPKSVPDAPCDQSVTNSASETAEDLSDDAGDTVFPGLDGGPRRARTDDPRIKSPLLYQLS